MKVPIKLIHIQLKQVRNNVVFDQFQWNTLQFKMSSYPFSNLLFFNIFASIFKPLSDIAIESFLDLSSMVICASS